MAEYADDEPAAQLSRIPIPLRNHQSRRLALLPFRLEFPRCRRSPCRTGAVDEDGDVLDILVQSRRNRRAATRFFRKLLKRQGREPRRLITDKLRSYSAAHRTVMPSVIHSTQQHEKQSRGSLASINPPAGAADAQVQVRPPICNGSPRCTASSRISSGSDVTCSGQLTTVS